MWRRGGHRVRIKRRGSDKDGGEKFGMDRSQYLNTSAELEGDSSQGTNQLPTKDNSCIHLDTISSEEDTDSDESENFEDLKESISIRSRSFHLETISLRYNLLKEQHVKTLCVTLMYNKSVKSLDLRCCQLSNQSCQYVCEMLSHNHVITLLDLSENNLRTNGLILLRDGLLFNMALSKLYLDCNEFIDSDAIHIYKILKTCKTLRELSIKGNQFCTAAGEIFLQMLRENASLTCLNISWNQLRMRATIQFIQGLAMNCQLRELDISWNGLGLHGSVAMAKCLKLNTTLKFLDLSSNRVTREAFVCLIDGLLANQTLETLKIGDNPITTDGVMDFMKILVKTNPQQKMRSCREIDFADICVGNDFATLYTEIRRHRDVIIKHGSALRQADLMQIDMAKVIHSEQPVFILFDCMKKSNLRIVDLFHAFDKDKSGALSRQELKEGLLSMSIPLSSRALDLLIKSTDTDNDGEISLTDLMAVQKDYQKHLAKKRSQEQREKPESAARRRAIALMNLKP